MRILLLGLGLAAMTAVHAGERPRINYMLHCSGCHQADGSGAAANGVPDMRGQLGHFLRTPEGRAFLVQVPGTSQAALDDAAVAELLNWMVPAFARQEMPVDFVPYSREEVARLRAHPLDDVPGFRDTLIRRLQQLGYRVE